MDTYMWNEIYPIAIIGQDIKEKTFLNVAAEINALLGPGAFNNPLKTEKVLGKNITNKNDKFVILDDKGADYATYTTSVEAIQAILCMHKMDSEFEKFVPAGEEAKIVEEFVKVSGKVNDNGTFKAGFDGCVKHMEGQGKTAESAAKLCAYIGRKAGKIKSDSPVKKEEAPVVEENKTKPNYGVKKNDSGLSWEVEIPIHKLDGEKQLVGGVVYEPDVVDAQGDSASEEEIQKAAHNFMIDSKTVGIMHKEDAGPRAKIVESYITTARMQIGTQFVKRGTWVMVVKILDPELWNMVKTGQYTGFSMGGRAVEDTSATV